MKLQAIVSSVALAAAFTFSGAAQAQTYMLDGVQIPTEQVQEFKDRCEALRAASTASLAESVDETTTGSINTDASQSSAGSTDPASRANWDEALASLTREECDQAGFGANAM